MKSRRKKAEVAKRSAPFGETAATGSAAPRLPRWLLPAFIPLATFIAFLPALQNGFVDWDDYKNLVENPHYRGLAWTELRWMFTTFHIGHYHPLTWMSFGLDYWLWGMDPMGYHLASLVLHAANALLFYFVSLRLLRLGFSLPVLPQLSLPVAAAVAALFFSLHPLRVESVAWATERRDVLSGFFLLSTVLCYLRAITAAEGGQARWRWLAAAWIVYALALLSKAIGMTLPLILLILDVYPLKRLGGGRGKWFGLEARKVWWEKIPFLL
ncbi:MAG: hypothetical protein ACREP8_02080, partial [Candidatus Binatia bacterium]